MKIRPGRAAVRVAFLAVLATAVWLSAAPLWAANFLWRVTGPQGGEAYILGSIHLAHPGLYPLREPIMEAFADSAALVVEIDMDGLPPDAVNRFISTHGLSSDLRPLPERLVPATRALLEKSGYYQAYMDNLTPWMAALSIQMDVLNTHGFEPQYGLDKYFLGLARSRGLPILSLETLDDQLGMLADMDAAQADLFLRSTLLEIGDLPQTIQTFLDSWNSGDVAKFAAVFFQEYDKYPELRPLLDRIIFRRNDTMAARIEGLLRQSKTHFIVVGAGHLAGGRSILARLSAKGFSITQL
ncbi:MAG: TraB/GumN family protein [Candidatus Adiutrix sp.]|nr:TraB/GumN family protein [Candidatus Adiutrix sp.]